QRVCPAHQLDRPRRTVGQRAPPVDRPRVQLPRRRPRQRHIPPVDRRTVHLQRAAVGRYRSSRVGEGRALQPQRPPSRRLQRPRIGRRRSRSILNNQRSRLVGIDRPRVHQRHLPGAQAPCSLYRLLIGQNIGAHRPVNEIDAAVRQRHRTPFPRFAPFPCTAPSCEYVPASRSSTAPLSSLNVPPAELLIVPPSVFAP